MKSQSHRHDGNLPASTTSSKNYPKPLRKLFVFTPILLPLLLFVRWLLQPPLKMRQPLLKDVDFSEESEALLPRLGAEKRERVRLREGTGWEWKVRYCVDLHVRFNQKYSACYKFYINLASGVQHGRAGGMCEW